MSNNRRSHRSLRFNQLENRLLLSASPNYPPTVDEGIADQASVVDEEFRFAVPADAFADRNGDDLAITVDRRALPGWLNYNTRYQRFEGKPNEKQAGTYTIEVAASDGQASTSTDFQLVITGGSSNSAPQVDEGIEDQVATIGQLFQFSVPSDAFEDPNGDQLTYAADNLPGWLVFNPGNREFQGTPVASDVGARTIVVKASDGESSATTTFKLTVPSVPTGGGVSVNQGFATQYGVVDTEFEFTIPDNVFSATNGAEIEYSVAKRAVPGWLNFDSNTNSFDGKANNSGDVGTYKIEVVASVGDSSAVAFLTLVVRDIDSGNQAPQVDAGVTDQFATVGNTFSFQLPSNVFSDPDGDTLTISAFASTLPDWLNFNASNQTFTGTPDGGDVGSTVVRVGASDGQLSRSTTFRVTVGSVGNRPPVVAAGIPIQTARVGEAFSFQVPANTFSDPDGNALTITAVASTVPGWLNYNTASQTFSGTPATSDLGNVGIRIEASDGQSSTSTLFGLVVAPNPADGTGLVAEASPAFITLGSSTNGVTEVTISLIVDGSNCSSGLVDTIEPFNVTMVGPGLNQTFASTALVEADGWVEISGGFLRIPGGPTPGPEMFSSFTVAVPDTVAGTFDVLVDDVAFFQKGFPCEGIESGSITDDGVAVEVGTGSTPVNRAPVVDDGVEDQSAVAGQAFVFRLPADAFSDPDGDALTLSVDNGSLPNWLNFNSSNKTLSGTPGAGDVGSETIQVRASDGQLTSTTTFDIDVAAAPTGNSGLAVSASTPVISVGSSTTGAQQVVFSIIVDASNCSTGLVDTIEPFSVTVAGPGSTQTIASSEFDVASEWLEIAGGFLRVPGGATAGPEVFATFTAQIPDSVTGVYTVAVDQAAFLHAGFQCDTTVSGVIDGTVVVS